MKKGLLVYAIALGLFACQTPQSGFQYDAPVQPEIASGYTEKPGWAFKQEAVAAANPLAVDAGYQILKAGGSAVDAAIAIQMVLTLVEPQSSGIGGGAFLLHWNGESLEAYDGRETAPAAAEARMFMGDDGNPLNFAVASIGGRAVATPGTLRMLEQAHLLYGKLGWGQLFKPAIILATEGFKMSPRLYELLKNDKKLKEDPYAAKIFYQANGEPIPVGSLVKNPALAKTLLEIAKNGSSVFYTGEMAKDIVDRVKNSSVPGFLSLEDLANYEPKMRQPICTDWRTYKVCGFPPPSSGHLTIMQILEMTDNVYGSKSPLQADGLPEPGFLHAYSEASRLAYADRNQYIGDPDFVAVPGAHWTSLLNNLYLKNRSSQIRPGHSMRVAQPGVPPGAKISYASQLEQPEYGTSHISIVDRWGNALAMTSTIENVFGAHIMTNGFLLNNEMTDFSFSPYDAQGRPVANRIEPGKRPRSSMSPTLVFEKDSGKFVMSVGSPGGSTIIHYTAKTLLGNLGWGLSPQQAISLPNFGSTNGPTILETGRFPEGTVTKLKSWGHEVKEQDLTSGIQAIRRTETELLGGADPRREGIVMGQ